MIVGTLEAPGILHLKKKTQTEKTTSQFEQQFVSVVLIRILEKRETETDLNGERNRKENQEWKCYREKRLTRQ